MRLTTLLVFLCNPATLSAQNRDADERALLHHHAEILRAHLEGDVGEWMSMEADTVVSVNGGRVSFPLQTERWEQRSAYLENASFSIYRDVREPIVRISDDGSLGWVIAEVERKGTRSSADGEVDSFHDFWAWIELYQKTSSGWQVIGNASNKRPPAETDPPPERVTSAFQGLRTVLYAVDDLDKAKAWYSRILGIEPYFDQPFYVGYNVGGYELALDPNAESAAPGENGTVVYWGVDDAEAALKRVLSLGATPHGDIQDVGGGVKTASVLDPFGNVFGIIENPNFKLQN